jgi:TetR/AcrR family transcriptional repressor of mexAB-oprM operon
MAPTLTSTYIILSGYTMARRTKEDAEKTREALLDAAETLFLHQGVAATTLDQIAREADLTRGAVYWHFENKMDLFRAMVVRVRQPIELMYEELFSQANEDMVAGLKHLCIETLRTLEKNTHMRNVFTIMRLRCEQLNSDTDTFAKDINAKRQVNLQRLTKVFTWAEKHKRLAKGVTPEFAAIALHSYFSGIYWDYLREPKTYKLNKLAPQLIESFFRGILKD